jgi:hypothetical protein
VCKTSADFDPDIKVFRSISSSPVWYVLLPDGSRVTLRIRRWGSNGYYLDVTVTVLPVRSGGLAGLCGTNDGNGSNDRMGAFGNCTEGTLLSHLRARLLVAVDGHALLFAVFHRCE